MNKTRNCGGGSRRPPNRPRSPARYSVGYSKPPEEHRFKPGQSGNPKGRPKGTKNTATVLREILDRKVEMRIGGILRKVCMREAMLMRFAEAALKGDTKAAGFLLQRYDMEETVNEHSKDVATQDELEFIEAYMQNHAKAKGEQR
jgi:Family of unknown function (DUF5681)